VFKQLLAVVALAASMVIGSASAGAAFVSYEEAYIEVHVNPTTLIGGNSFDGYATSNVDCNWTVTFRGESQTDFGDRIDFTFDTPVVEEEIERDLDVTCIYDDTQLEMLGASKDADAVTNAGYVISNAPATLHAADQELGRTVVITILPLGSDDDDDDDDDDSDSSSSSASAGSDLPSAGGVDAGWIYGGAALVLAGSAAIFLVRRRNESPA
jgi:hypothetical protein